MASSVYAAGEGDGDGIPWDKPLNLVYILNAPAVVRINCWKDVGLELGVEKHVLDRIDRDCRGLTNDCKREMFNYWLNNDFQPSWEKVSHAVKEVRRRLDGTSHQLSSTCASTTVNVFATKPTLAQLKIMKTARGEKIEIINCVAPQWKQLGILFNFDAEGRAVDLIEAEKKLEGPVVCCEETIKYWLKGNGIDATWKAVIELLEDMGESALAKQVKSALLASRGRTN